MICLDSTFIDRIKESVIFFEEKISEYHDEKNIRDLEEEVNCFYIELKNDDYLGTSD